MKTPYFARYKDGTRIEVLRQDATHVECVNAGPDGPAVWRTALANITPEQPEATEARTKEANAGASGMAADWNELKALRADLAKAQARCAELEMQLFGGDDPWPARAFLAELAAKHNHYLAARSDGG